MSASPQEQERAPSRSGSKPEWHAEAIRLHTEGMSRKTIGRKFGVHTSTVTRAIDPDGERAKHRARVRKSRAKEREERGDVFVPPHQSLVEPYVYRTPRQIINREAVMPAARLFARGKIDRHELMILIGK